MSSEKKQLSFIAHVAGVGDDDNHKPCVWLRIHGAVVKIPVATHEVSVWGGLFNQDVEFILRPNEKE